jgi:predicted Zn-dependent protease
MLPEMSVRREGKEVLTMKRYTRTMMSAAVCLASLSLLGSCSGSGGGGGSSGGNAAITDLLGSGASQVLGGRNSQWVDPIKTAVSAEFVTKDDEKQLGETVAIAATNRWPYYDKPELNKYVTMVGLAVATASPTPDSNWVFGVLDTPELGAYSGPNGYIMVTRGAIAAMQDEAELAGVLAHEIAHVLNHDGLEAVKQGRRTEAIAKGLSAADQRVAAFNQLSNNLIEKTLTSGYSQGQETNADSRAVQLLMASGYDPNGLTRFLKRLEERKGGSAKLFSTHPGTADRIARVSSQAAGAKAGATNKERFAKAAAEAKL